MHMTEPSSCSNNGRNEQICNFSYKKKHWEIALTENQKLGVPKKYRGGRRGKPSNYYQSSLTIKIMIIVIAVVISTVRHGERIVHKKVDWILLNKSNNDKS